MKKILFLSIALAIISCKKETPINYALISGKITNTSSEKITIVNQYNSSKPKKIAIAKDGTFADTIYIDKTNSYNFYENRNAFGLHLSKGDNVIINYNAKKLDSTLSFSGTGTAISKYLADKKIVGNTLVGDPQKFYLKSEQEYKEALLKVKKAREDALFNANGLPEDFKKNEAKSINYEYLSSIGKYELYHGYYTKNRAFKASEGFADELKSIATDTEEDFIFSQPYRSLVANHYQKEASKMIEKDSTLAQEIAFLKAIATNKNQTIKNKLLFDDARYGITYTENLEDYYKLFLDNSTNKENNKTIKESYDKLMSLATGNPSPKFTDFENNAGGTNSLEDYKGKFVYIDVWATWCGPCIAEIPSLKKLEKQYHSKNIEFISLSIDNKKDHKKWKKMIIDRDLKGVQLFADNNWESKFVQDYQIKGIPRFILIDPKGNIVTANAPRPSDSKLITLFNEHKI